MVRGRIPLRPKMRLAGKIVKQTFEYLEPNIIPGMRLDHLDDMAHKYMLDHSSMPAPLGYKLGGKPPFPKSICTSVNEVAAHGIPDNYLLAPGDVLKIDISLSIDGHFADACRTYIVGDADEEVLKFVSDVQFVHHNIIEWIMQMAEGGEEIWTGDIGEITEGLCEMLGIYPAHGCGGHGIGRALHLDPFIPPNTRSVFGRGVKLNPGQYFTVEPIIMSQPCQLVEGPDRWSIVAPRGVLTAQFEHTILLKSDGIEIIT